MNNDNSLPEEKFPLYFSENTLDSAIHGFDYCGENISVQIYIFNLDEIPTYTSLSFPS